MRLVRGPLLIALLTAALCLGLAQSPLARGQAAPAGLTVELVPAVVTPTPGEKARLLLIARNGSASAVKNLRLSWTNDTGATVKLSGSTTKVVKTLAAGSDIAWAINVSTPGAFVPGKVFFRLDYVVSTRHAASADDYVIRTRHIATAALDVNSPVSTKLEDIATVEVKTTLESLDQQHDGVVYLLATNKSATNLTVAGITPSGPPFVKFTKPKLTAPAKPANPSANAAPGGTSGAKPLYTIGPRETIKLPVTVKAKGRVRSGKHLLLFDVHLTWGTAPHLQNAHIITTHQAEFGVVGLSAALTVLGVPSFLFLPGFLMLVAASIFYGFRRPAGAPAELGLFNEKSPQFWGVAITLSIVMAIVYPILGGHNYLTDYSLRDVIYVWSVSIVVGLVACVLVVLGLQRRYERRTPNARDSQAETLKKLNRQKLGLNREMFEFHSGNKTYNGYLLQRRDGAEQVWLSPMIEVTITASGQTATQLLQRLNAATKPDELAKILDENASALEIKWDRQDGPDHPYQATAEELKAANEKPASRIVRAQ